MNGVPAHTMIFCAAVHDRRLPPRMMIRCPHARRRRRPWRSSASLGNPAESPKSVDRAFGRGRRHEQRQTEFGLQGQLLGSPPNSVSSWS